MPEEEIEELTQIKRCIIGITKGGKVKIKCEEPITELEVSPEELNFISGVSTDVKKVFKSDISTVDSGNDGF